MPDDRRHVGAQAQRQAVSRLIANHRDEYQNLLGDEREALGLPREAKAGKKPSRLDILREQLKAQGIEPKI